MNATAIAKCKKKILDTILILEGGDAKTALNYGVYKEKLKHISDRDLVNMIKNNQLRMNIVPMEYEFKLENIKKAMTSLGRNLEEKVTLPFMYNDPDIGAPISDKKAMILRLPIIKLIQKSATENASASSTTKRDKTNQVINDSKGAGISDAEIQQLSAGCYEHVIDELLTFRADNDKAKQEAYSNILRTGRTSIPKDVEDGRIALLYAYMCYIGMGIDTDLME